jgi:hypothetical protein
LLKLLGILGDEFRHLLFGVFRLDDETDSAIGFKLGQIKIGFQDVFVGVLKSVVQLELGCDLLLEHEVSQLAAPFGKRWLVMDLLGNGVKQVSHLLNES